MNTKSGLLIISLNRCSTGQYREGRGMSGVAIARNCHTKAARMEHILHNEVIRSWRIVVNIAIAFTLLVDSRSILCCKETSRA